MEFPTRILPHTEDFSNDHKSVKNWRNSKKLRGLSRTVRYIQKCNKNGTSDQDCDYQIIYLNVCPIGQVYCKGGVVTGEQTT
jgi:hypothetical protein